MKTNVILIETELTLQINSNIISLILQPPSREVCDRLFVAADRNHSGGIDEHEFVKIMGVCCAQILSRMLIYYLVLILLVPIVSAQVVDWIRIENGSYTEMATEQLVSTALFFAAIPLLWDRIDRSSQKILEGKEG